MYRSIKSSLLGYVLAWFFLSSLSGTGHVLDLQILDGYKVITADKISSSLFYPAAEKPLRGLAVRSEDSVLAPNPGLLV